MRRRSRECALQILYQMDVAKDLGDPGRRDEEHTSRVIGDYWASFDHDTPVDRAHVERLVRGVTRELDALDAAVAAVSQHWRVGRMSAVDRNLIRVAAYEILYCPDVPRAAAINEAVEIAKRFSGAESAAFINGVLDQLRQSGEESHDRR